MREPKILQQIRDDIVHLGWVPPGEVEFEVFPPDEDDPAWHVYTMPRTSDGKPFSLELTLIADRLDVTSIVFDTGTEKNAPPSVRIRGMVGKTPVMVCVLQRRVRFDDRMPHLLVEP